MSAEFGSQFLHQLPDRHVSVVFNPLFHCLDFGVVFLPAGLPFHPELAFLALTAIMGEAKEVKGFWFSCISFGSSFCCETSKFQNFALLGRDG